MPPMKPHAVIVPWPAPAHENLLMSFAKLLHSHGFHITFVRSTMLNLRPTISSNVPESEQIMPHFRFETIQYDTTPPSALSNLNVANDVPLVCRSLRKNGLRSFKPLLAKLNSSSDITGVPPVSCVVADGVMSFAVQAAMAIGVPGFSFITSSAFTFVGYLLYRELILKGIFSFKTDGTHDLGVGYADKGENAQLRHFPSFYQATDPNEIMFRHMLAEAEDCLTSSTALIFNNFDDFEFEAVEAVKKKYNRGNIYSIGPLALLQKKRVRNTNVSELRDQNPTVFNWLEKRAPNSVLYVNYGYVALMSDRQVEELAWGIVNSGQPFLWVTKDGRVGTLPELALLEEIYEDRGLIVSQCAQETSVLCHRAVGAFLTLCDYNSMMEAICGGVPVICLPFSDVQKANCHCACSPTWGIGMKMSPDVNRIEVSALVREMIVGEEGKRKREKAQEWKLKGERATHDVGGSSYDNLHKFINETRKMKYMIRLYNAAMVGDWTAAERIFEAEGSMLTATLTTRGETALHIAALAGQWEFLEKMVELLPPEALATRNPTSGDTVLPLAILGENTRVVKALVLKNGSLLRTPDAAGFMPIEIAAGSFSKDMMGLLMNFTRDDDDESVAFTGTFLNIITSKGWYDIALDLLERHPYLGTKRSQYGISLLDVLVDQLLSLSVSHFNFWKCIIYFFIPVEITTAPRHTIEDKLPQLVVTPREHPITSRGTVRGKTLAAQMIKGINTISRRLNMRMWKALMKLGVLVVPVIKEIYTTKLARKQVSELVERVCLEISSMPQTEIADLLSPTLVRAARNGCTEIFKKCVQTFPLIMWTLADLDSDPKNLLQIAVLHRQEKIFNFLCGMTPIASILPFNNPGAAGEPTLLHMVARLPSSTPFNTLPGPALQMQRELQWFEEVKKIDLPAHLEKKNDREKTPQMLFSKEHEDLMEKGEKWMRDTAQSCMVVATLIATVVFAAIFTVPGGSISDPNRKDNGLPIFLHRNYFMLFAVSDAIALFSSLTSVLVFLSILTSRYAEEDFLYSLPKRLIIGLAMLFLSIAATMITFGAALSIMLSDRVKWISIPTTLAACVPVVVFIFSHLSLFVQVFNSTYRSDVLLNSNK